MTDYRRETSKSVRVSAAELAEQREHPQHHSNGDEEKYAGEFYLMNFTKGLEHCEETGLIECPEDFELSDGLSTVEKPTNFRRRCASPGRRIENGKHPRQVLSMTCRDPIVRQ